MLNPASKITLLEASSESWMVSRMFCKAGPSRKGWSSWQCVVAEQRGGQYEAIDAGMRSQGRPSPELLPKDPADLVTGKH